ncbi:hypothetical protein [Mucilaginibacter gracilis]|uniref:hypothetical protein n=1 Tax=Mucilaginibacter gracilis TaxID=423350 RepID=UPI00025559FB|nr:hypothetical protein [Mucilaginibacter gracilis]
MRQNIEKIASELGQRNNTEDKVPTLSQPVFSVRPKANFIKFAILRAANNIANIINPAKKHQLQLL